MDKQAGPVAEISLERGELLLTGMKISPYTVNSRKCLGWSGCLHGSLKMPPQAIFSNCPSLLGYLAKRAKQQSRSLSLRSSGRNVRLWDNQFQGGI
jgi:hypothetical protein